MKFLSVKEYAERTGKDPGNIRRLLAAGRLEGSKVGNQWCIPENAAYPEDRREKSGQYRNWRRRTAVHADRELMRILSPMISDLRGIYGDRLESVILYGSYARGTQTDESDVDIAVLLREKPDKNMQDRMIECVASYELESGKVLSVLDIDARRFREWVDVLPFYRNIEKEGVVLWKAA